MQQLRSLLNPVRTRAEAAAARDGEWAAWQYAEDEWAAFDEAEWQRGWRRVGGYVAFFGIWTVVFDFLFAQTPLGTILPFLLTWTVGMGLVCILSSLARSRARRQARQQGPREIRITPLKVIQPGATLTLNGSGWEGLSLDLLNPPMHTLRSVQIDAPDSHTLIFRGIGGRSWPVTIRVPIPRGREQEAEQLVGRFYGEILRPSVSV